jgi:hypothetical protein
MNQCLNLYRPCKFNYGNSSKFLEYSYDEFHDIQHQNWIEI